MLSPGQLRSNLLVKLGELTGRTHALPLVLFAPTARCNSRCVSCGWWRADGAGDLTLPEIGALAAELPRYGTKVVVLTGGEPLLRADVMEVADIFLRQGMTLHLLTSGLALERFAPAIAERFADVTVSLDGHTAELYRTIRGVDALGVVAAGVAKLRRLAPAIPLRARSTLHRHNFRFLAELGAKSVEMGFDQIVSDGRRHLRCLQPPQPGARRRRGPGALGPAVAGGGGDRIRARGGSDDPLAGRRSGGAANRAGPGTDCGASARITAPSWGKGRSPPSIATRRGPAWSSKPTGTFGPASSIRRSGISESGRSRSC